MALGSRRVGLLVCAAASAALAGCGGSVADAVAPIPTSVAAAPRTPFCAAAKDNADALRPLNTFAQQGSVPPGKLEDTVDAVRRSGIELLAAAPADIRPDVQVVVDALDTQLDALVRANGDVAAVARDPQASASAAGSDAVAAARRVSAYITRACQGFQR